MKPSSLSIVASLCLTGAMGLVVFAFEYVKTKDWFNNVGFIVILFVLSVIFFINYTIVSFLFRFYGKEKIRQISTILPDEIATEDENINFKELGERISGLSEKASSEIDMMKEMERYRKEYIGNISHELKTPLFSIQSYVGTLIDGGVEDLEIRDKYLHRIDKSLDRLMNIVKDLDMINRFESGEITLDFVKFDLNVLVKEIFDFLDIEAQKKGTQLSLKSNGAIWVLADKQKISQVLLNLVSNAIHYANREKAVVEVITSVHKDKVVVEVKDNGMGIKPEILPRVFERFYRVESSRNRREGGSGLGLAIVKHILEAHGQSIEAKSVYLSGASFIFTLDKA
ncbi:sensor histidine kinase [Riemerella anatipestifer]|uniref:sensor histidine kinase n=1 Tax=Riemerella anatipestifer TaxID=34085 RepID=UPI0012B31985|nr:ATP-binding protein [Riemerella anatipestifer]MBT0551558.1 two-component sensor histidine kinase [Riemerella anatipestifer]MBT0552757.1 two-component sensor histidine kinase [Riemerella anatipestifer]MCE3023493.1 ATP-binding protein [Riemerella anatipestifer]MCU7558921.1 ATP-binding protein [Riemerella anatipestifer]MDY3448158.1 ATP-binding protein [Riemerella anatipestifer]